jgi:hypothetical protein
MSSPSHAETENPERARTNAQATRRRIRSLVALCDERLRATRPARVARWLGRLTVVGFAAVAITLRVMDGAEASLSGITSTAAHWLPWIIGAPLAFAAAEDRAARDRRDGIETLARSRGISARGIESARMLAAMTATTRAIGAPLLTLTVLVALLAGRLPVAIERAATCAGAVTFAVIAGVTLGGAGALCGRVGREHGRWLLAAVVLGPWVLADLAGRGAWSLPGALDAVLEFTGFA